MARAAEPAPRPHSSSQAGAAAARRLPSGFTAGARIGAVVSTYHRDLTGAMLASARAELEAAGLEPEQLVVVEVPGAFELPIVARSLGAREDIRAVLCFGLVLKGETSHDVHIAAAVSQALQRVALDIDTPMLFGVLTCETLEQARARALPASQGGSHDKGREVARAALDVLHALEQARLPETAKPRAGFGVSIPREGRP
jgi:6,7-dimethyl-8-ribityllumazine synthase